MIEQRGDAFEGANLASPTEVCLRCRRVTELEELERLELTRILAREWDFAGSFAVDDPEQEYPMGYALFRETDGKLIGHFCVDSVDLGGSISSFLNEEYCSRAGVPPKLEQCWAEVTFVLIASEERGNGLGRQLMQHAKDILLQSKTFVGVVLQCKTALKGFYERCGFQAIPTPPSQRDQDNPEAELWMIAF